MEKLIESQVYTKSGWVNLARRPAYEYVKTSSTLKHLVGKDPHQM